MDIELTPAVTNALLTEADRVFGALAPFADQHGPSSHQYSDAIDAYAELMHALLGKPRPAVLGWALSQVASGNVPDDAESPTAWILNAVRDHRAARPNRPDECCCAGQTWHPRGATNCYRKAGS
ncbi:hypothetical protein [Dactylosporangium sp. CS-033363]|uniref:hypothetical protein n=1 Tax=Dactylosporangium sp. CS-033363 TaxID=3239935 RepID=UPI003D8E0E2E